MKGREAALLGVHAFFLHAHVLCGNYPSGSAADKTRAPTSHTGNEEGWKDLGRDQRFFVHTIIHIDRERSGHSDAGSSGVRSASVSGSVPLGDRELRRREQDGM